jgi:hypothetical protein
MDDFLLSGQAARLIEGSVDLVRHLERIGRLKAIRAGHVRLFRRDDVEKFAMERRAQRRSSAPTRLTTERSERR